MSPSETLFGCVPLRVSASAHVRNARAAARNAGLDDAKAREVLDAPTAELGELDEQMQRFARGVSGVPFFIVSDGKKRFKLSGAQPPEAFLEVFEDLGIEE